LCASAIVDSVPAATLVRQPTPADEEAFVAAVRGSRDLHEPWIEPPDTAVRYAQYLDRISKPEYAGFLVIDMADGGLAGFVNINEIVLGAFASGYLGYAAFAGKAGRGLMRDGLAQVIGIAFGVLGLHRLEANIQPSNKPSISLVTRLGFRHEGFSPQYLMVAGAWRDHERFALTAEDWASRPQRTDPSDWRQ
jgi:ribosomal-protein-alanine N-acetyltransferase